MFPVITQGFPATQCKTTTHIVASVNPWQDSGWLPIEPHSPSRQCYFPHHCAPQNPFPFHPWLPLPLTEGDSKLLREQEHLALAFCRNPQSNPRKPFAKAWKPLFTSGWFLFHTPSISFTVCQLSSHLSWWSRACLLLTRLGTPQTKSLQSTGQTCLELSLIYLHSSLMWF